MLLLVGVAVGLVGFYTCGEPDFPHWLWRPMIAATLFVASSICGVGFAVYDFRWPFGPRPNVGSPTDANDLL